MSEETLKHFTDIYDIPYSIVTALYIAVKYVLYIAVSIYFCSYCCNCKKACEEKACPCWEKSITSFFRWLIRIIFGKSEGVSEEKDEEVHKQIRVEKQGNVHINHYELKCLHTNVLGVIILCFGLLVGITMYTAYLLEVSHVCSEDTAVYCFPQLIDPNNPNSPSLNISDRQNPITDCNRWTNSSIAPFVTFQCFRYAFNAKEALVTAGGLLAFFVITMRITISLFVKIYDWVGEKCGLALQYSAFILLALFNLAATIIVMSFVLNDRLGSMEDLDTPVAQQIASYIADNGIQFLIISGTAELLLLPPWYKCYTTQNVTRNTDMEMD